MSERPPDPVPPRLRELIARQRPGHALEGELYTSEEIYRLDIEHIWRRSWLFAGHSCEIPRPGDYFTFAVDTDSIIVIRDDGGGVAALHNVCRHRGSLVLKEPSGHAGRLVCPYHQWTYARDGRLLGCRGMPESFDKARHGLEKARARELEGLIFVSLAAEPPEFESAAADLGPVLRPQGFRRARVARAIDYEIPASWKLVWENNRECYHCNANHPQYIKANFDHFNEDDASERVREAIARETARSEAKWAACGLAVTHKETGMTVFPGKTWYSVNRTALAPGYVSETMDGRQKAPLMGDYADPDVGTLRIRTLPNFWNHSSCDHGVSTRLLPAGPERTLARVTWLVDEKAVEGKDYRLEDILPFWQLTSEQDWEICANQQRGVRSSAYRPGPYSLYKEYNVEGFARWYLGRLGGS